MEQEKLELIDKIDTCFTGAKLGLDELAMSFEDTTKPFELLQDLGNVLTNYKCPQCGKLLYIHHITEVDVVFYCKECDEKVKGRI